jgi:hypothetical protein
LAWGALVVLATFRGGISPARAADAPGIAIGCGHSEKKDAAAAGSATVFGFYGSGETGPPDNDSPPRGVGYHICACAVRRK